MKRSALYEVLAVVIVVTALASGAAVSQSLPWRDACIAIQPTMACTAANRPAIEEAMASCRQADDKPSCHRRYLTQRQERPAKAPTIIRGSSVK